MSASSSKKQKPPRQRPVATSQLANAVSEEVHRTDELFHCFSPEANHFALLLPVLNKHRLCIYDAATGQVIAEHSPDEAQVTAVSWGSLIYSLGGDSLQVEKQSPSKKRKKHIASHESNKDQDQSIQVVALGLSNGATELFSPVHGRVLRTLSDPSLNSAVSCVRLWSMLNNGNRSSLACVATTGGDVFTWNASQNIPTGKWRHDPGEISIFEFNPHDGTFLIGSTSISLCSISEEELLNNSSVKPKQISQFHGHASRVKGLTWELTKEPRRFVSRSESDRFLNVWEVPTSQGSPRDGLLTSIGMGDHVRHICLDPNAPPEEQLVFGLTSSNNGAIYVLPMTKTQSKATTPARAKVRVVEGPDVRFELVSAAFVPKRRGILRLAFLVGGIRLLLEDVSFQTIEGQFVEDIVLDKKSVNSDLFKGDHHSLRGTEFKRYQERPGFAVGSIHDKGIESQGQTGANPELEGVLDVDMAELSLGQRLAAVQAVNPKDPSTETAGGKERESIPLGSLTRTLTQALHSSDSRLLELCLSHSEPSTIQNTVERLSPQFALPLLNACIERLGRGHRGTNLKGGGGGASSQRGTSLITWVRAVLIIHSGHLMAIPDLASKLSGLHGLLTSRLAMHDRLLALSGRLDLVLTQMELRSSNRPAPITPVKKDRGSSRGRNAVTTRYVEGESSDEAEQDRPDLEFEDPEDNGSVEDIEFLPDDQVAEDTDDSEDEGVSDGRGSVDESGSEPDRGNLPSRPGRTKELADAEADEWSESENESDNYEE